MTSPGWETLGRATTHGQAMPLGTDDPVIAARAVRRALAAAGHRATDVFALAVASRERPSPEVLARFARRALGPRGDAIRTASVDAPVDSTADSLAVRAAEHLDAEDPRVEGVGIAVGLAPDGTTVALCIRCVSPSVGPRT